MPEGFDLDFAFRQQKWRLFPEIAPVLQHALQQRRCSDKVNTLLVRRFFSTGTFAVLAVSN
jgi:hypothetical protein